MQGLWFVVPTLVRSEVFFIAQGIVLFGEGMAAMHSDISARWCHMPAQEKRDNVLQNNEKISGIMFRN